MRWVGVTTLLVGVSSGFRGTPEARAQVPVPSAEDVAAARAPQAQLPARIEVRNELGKAFRLVGVRVVMDGRVILERSVVSGSELTDPLPAWEGPVSPGTHHVFVNAQLEGRDRGLFRYLDEMAFNVESTQSFVAPAAGAATATLVLARRGGLNVPIERQPTVRLEPTTSVAPAAFAGAAASEVRPAAEGSSTGRAARPAATGGVPAPAGVSPAVAPATRAVPAADPRPVGAPPPRVPPMP